jgi:hypothetical protein
VFVVSPSCFSFFVLLSLSRSMLLASGFVVCFPLSLKGFRLKKKKKKNPVCAKGSSWNLLKAVWRVDVARLSGLQRRTTNTQRIDNSRF